MFKLQGNSGLFYAGKYKNERHKILASTWKIPAKLPTRGSLVKFKISRDLKLRVHLINHAGRSTRSLEEVSASSRGDCRFFHAIGGFVQAKQVKMSWELVDGLKYDYFCDARQVSLML